MYTREIQAPRASPIEDGNPITGTWNRAFDKVNLHETRKPYSYPLPRWVINSRIKEWNSFCASNGDFLLGASFYNLKLYRVAQIFVYDIQSGEKILFRKIKPGTGWTLPGSLANSSINSNSSSFYFRIHSWLDAGIIRLDVNIAPTLRRPSLTAHLAFDASDYTAVPVVVSLGTAERGSTCQRIMYAYKTLAPVRGDIDWGGRRISLKNDACSGFFCDYKGFMPYRMQTAGCSAAGIKEENKRFGFHITDNQTREQNKNNENVLWIDGKLTLLPPVRITMPNGPDGTWVIQDVEGMIDLTFTPKDCIKNNFTLLFTNAEFLSLMGYYNGMLLSCEGEQIQIKNLFGIGEKLNLRV